MQVNAQMTVSNVGRIDLTLDSQTIINSLNTKCRVAAHELEKCFIDIDSLKRSRDIKELGDLKIKVVKYRKDVENYLDDLTDMSERVIKHLKTVVSIKDDLNSSVGGLNMVIYDLMRTCDSRLKSYKDIMVGIENIENPSSLKENSSDFPKPKPVAAPVPCSEDNIFDF